MALEKLAQGLRKGDEAADLTGELFRIGARRVIQEFLESEVEEVLGRGYYGRKSEENNGYRNGYKKRYLDTAEGRLAIDLPQVRDTDEPFSSKALEAIKEKDRGVREPGS
ncbi:MAG: transposase [Firmicutes bacterium]|nr:transposase [Bacillota bacterium]